MKERSILKRFGPWILGLVAGLVLAGSFAPIESGSLAWIGPAFLLVGPLLAPRQAFKIGLISGFSYHLCSLYWLLFIPFPAGAIAGWLALSAYLSLFTAAWVVFSVQLLPTTPTSLDLDGPCPGWHALISASWTSRATWAFVSAAAWVGSELVQARFLTGFPWNLLGVSQFKVIPLIQIASVTGVYGVSFLIVWLSLSLMLAVLSLATAKPSLGRALSQATLPAIVVAACFISGFQRLATSQPPERELKIALVQPSIPQTLMFDPAQHRLYFQRLLTLTELALASRPQLLVWPEAAVPGLLRYDTNIFQALTNLLVPARAWGIVGADDAEPKDHGPNPGRIYFNSSFLISPQGKIHAIYRKRRLVIFGEYVPFARVLPILRQLTPIEGEFQSGAGPVPFTLTDLNVTTSTLICFEDNFPHLTRGYVDDNTQFLLNLTNNGWFGESAAQWQHAANAIFRAIENGVPLVRCTNNGLTCWVDRYGRLRDEYFDGSANIYGEGFKIVRVPIEPPLNTFYHRFGDWFAWTCLGLAAGALLIPRTRR